MEKSLKKAKNILCKIATNDCLQSPESQRFETPYTQIFNYFAKKIAPVLCNMFVLFSIGIKLLQFLGEVTD